MAFCLASTLSKAGRDRRFVSLTVGNRPVLICRLERCFRTHSRHSRSSPEHNLAKVGVEGSNPFARSRFSRGNQSIREGLRGLFLLPRPWGRCRGSTGEAAGSGLWRAHGWRRSRRHPNPSRHAALLGPLDSPSLVLPVAPQRSSGRRKPRGQAPN